jgi:hypothetical protein
MLAKSFLQRATTARLPTLSAAAVRISSLITLPFLVTPPFSCSLCTSGLAIRMSSRNVANRPHTHTHTHSLSLSLSYYPP